MPLYRFQLAFAGDTQLERDQVVNTVHLNDAGVGTDPESLATDLLAAFRANWYGPVRYGKCTGYEVGPPPQFPVAFVESNVGNAPQSGCPREVALCLSYYSERNLPRQRGRIFLCAGMNGTIGTPAVRPDESERLLALNLGQAIADVGGADVDWVVYSPTDGEARSISHAWVDDEWDTIRSRGLDSTDREMITLNE